MFIKNFQDLSYSHDRAVIINYNTKKVSTLSLLSALKYAGMPVLLIDCESTDGSFNHFESLLDQKDFDLISAPLRNHGKTLDWLMPHIKADFVLLVDSDLEILDQEIIHFFKKYTCDHRVFGAGFTNGPGILNSEDFVGTPIFNGLYFERPWMPLAYFRTSHLKEALNAGVSFSEATLKKNSGWKKLLSFLIRKKNLSPFKVHMGNHKLIFFDTGALIYDYLRYHKHYFFAAIPEPLHHLHTRHFFGTTRNEISGDDNNTGGGKNAIEEEVRKRLDEKYDFSF